MAQPPVHELAPPSGFDVTGSGLIVPHDPNAPPSLEREQWTDDEAKVILRAGRVLDRHGLIWILGCQDNRCASDPQLHHRAVAGGFVWVCRHKERRILHGR